jgi:predicted O-methyltransferase YrrM
METSRAGYENMNEQSAGRFWFPSGHFYSPIPSLEEVRKREEKIFFNIPKEILGIDLNVKRQLQLLHAFKKYYDEMPFGIDKKKGLRFFFKNPSYSLSDAIFLYCMIRYTKPKRIIEIGSGFSSCIILDTNELFFDNSIKCTFIDPYPQLLLSLIKDTDLTRAEIIEQNLQDVEGDIFSELSDSDILFIDSTHVSKIDSDVNHIFFKILPRLNYGAYIHFHDIFYPFEYPKEWVYEGLAWNEAYLLRAFLQYNSEFKIQFFNTYLDGFYSDTFSDRMPTPLKYVGASIWLRKERSRMKSGIASIRKKLLRS